MILEVKISIQNKGNKMKKILISFLLVILLFSCISVQASNTRIIDEETSSKIIRLKDNELKDLEDYKKAYDSDTYGFTAYVLNKIRIFSIPLCFLGIVVGAIYQYVIGIRRLDIRYKGFYLMIAFITVLVICQVLPLIFVIVAKGWSN